MAARQLAGALENIRDLALFIRRADDHEHQEKLNGIADRLAIEGEYELYTNAKKKGVYYFPKYLNETVHDPLEYASQDTRRGATVGDPAVHFPAPRQRGDAMPPASEDAFWADRETTREVHPPGGM